MLHRVLLILIIGLLSFSGQASHVLGGEITWTKQGDNYVFQMIFYRDCNEAEFNTPTKIMRVWNHPTVTNVNLNFSSASDLSPTCTEVPGGPEALLCGIGANSGNGSGAVEKSIYISDPIALLGTPPAGGWVFTYETTFRSSNILNLVTSPPKGITLISKIYATPNSTDVCIDNSPQFLQEPIFVSCAGDLFNYHMNAIDPDLDSIHVSFGTPYDELLGLTYIEGIDPAPISFETGFSINSPTPTPAMNPANIGASIDQSSGELSFLSQMIGEFNLKMIAQSFRQGILIAEISREIVITTTNCTGNNSAPVIAGPFGGLFETTINAGDLVNFNLSATDAELLQDGTNQNNILSASGPMFGNNYTSNSGCAITPCATLDATPLITMSQGVNTTFTWQTDCDHLVNPYGFIAESIPYHFVFKIQDDYCPVPKVSYATITINVTNPGIIEAPVIDCIQTETNGDNTITWTAVTDPLGTFNSYQIYSLQNGLLGTIADINTTTFSIPSNGVQNDFYMASASACNGNTLRYSDTISNILLTLNNPGNGQALLQWNDPVNSALSSMGEYYHIYKEYPAGTWSLYDSVPFGNHFYTDTITVCEVFLNYQVILPNQPCDYSSNIAGDTFFDVISPEIPVIDFVTIDTITNQVTISWNENSHPDTYGYIIYIQQSNGSVVELDQVFGISNTQYTYNGNIANGPLTYSIAAFDSCLTANGTYRTSAKGNLHSTSFLTVDLDICTKSVDLEWSAYEGWGSIDHYEIFAHTENSPWTNIGSTTSLNYNLDAIPGETYTFAIQAISELGITSFSNPTEIFISAPTPPDFNYLKVATVYGNEVLLKHYIDANSNISELAIQRMNGVSFEEIARVTVVGDENIYIDSDVDVSSQSYVYRVVYIDSCGLEGPPSNEAKTILLNIQNDEVLKLNYLDWNPYQEFNGAIQAYNIYRGIDSVFGINPIATLGPQEHTYTDDVNEITSQGGICYYIEVIEAMNIYNSSEKSISNVPCIILPPIIFIPNAFIPDGFNAVFRPVISDFDYTSYELVVFDRWGQVIFKTNTPMEGWDGKIAFSNEMAQTGTYIYMLIAKDASGKEVTRRGHVSLLK